MWPVLFQNVSWPGFKVHSSGDTDCRLSSSVCELAWFLVCTLLVTQRSVLFQWVSWPGFNVHSSGDTDCGLSCFRQ
jgi:hypothetical protein